MSERYGINFETSEERKALDLLGRLNTVPTEHVRTGDPYSFALGIDHWTDDGAVVIMRWREEHPTAHPFAVILARPRFVTDAPDGSPAPPNWRHVDALDDRSWNEWDRTAQQTLDQIRSGLEKAGPGETPPVWEIAPKLRATADAYGRAMQDMERQLLERELRLREAFQVYVHEAARADKYQVETLRAEGAIASRWRAVLYENAALAYNEICALTAYSGDSFDDVDKEARRIVHMMDDATVPPLFVAAGVAATAAVHARWLAQIRGFIVLSDAKRAAYEEALSGVLGRGKLPPAMPLQPKLDSWFDRCLRVIKSADTARLIQLRSNGGGRGGAKAGELHQTRLLKIVGGQCNRDASTVRKGLSDEEKRRLNEAYQRRCGSYN